MRSCTALRVRLVLLSVDGLRGALYCMSECRCAPEPSGLRRPKGFGPPPALRPACANASGGRPRAFGRRAVAWAEAGPLAGEGSKSAGFPTPNPENPQTCRKRRSALPPQGRGPGVSRFSWPEGKGKKNPSPDGYLWAPSLCPIALPGNLRMVSEPSRDSGDSPFVVKVPGVAVSPATSKR
jgi:hypothetical protein